MSCRVYIDSCILIGATSLEDDKEIRDKCKKLFEILQGKNSSKIVISGLVFGEFLIKWLEKYKGKCDTKPICELFNLLSKIKYEKANVWPLEDKDTYLVMEILNKEGEAFLQEVIKAFRRECDAITTARDLIESDRFVHPSDALIIGHAMADKGADFFVTMEGKIITSIKIAEMIRKRGLKIKIKDLEGFLDELKNQK